MIVVNRPGAGGAIGYRHVAAQKPDGTSLVWNSNSISTTFHSGTLAFDYKSFVAVAQVLVELPVVAVKSDAKWKTLKDLIADGKARPKAITVGNSGVGSHTHISSVALFRPAGVDAVDVPFAAAQVVPSLLGGQVDAVVQLPARARAIRQERTGAVPRRHGREPRPRLPGRADRARTGLSMSRSKPGAGSRCPSARRWRPSPRSSLRSATRSRARNSSQACERLGATSGFPAGRSVRSLIAKEDA